MSGEPPSVYTSRTRKARKVHRCCECGTAIEVGTRYEYVSGIWDSRAASFKTCLRCAAVRDLACQCEDDTEWLPALGQLGHWLMDFAQEHELTLAGGLCADVIERGGIALKAWQERKAS